MPDVPCLLRFVHECLHKSGKRFNTNIDIKVKTAIFALWELYDACVASPLYMAKYV